MGEEQWFELDKRLEVIDKGSCSESHPTPLLFVHGGRLAAWCWDEIFWTTSPTGAIARLLLIFADISAARSPARDGGSPIAKPLNRCSIADYVDDVCSVVEDLPATAWTRLVRGDLTGAPVALEDHAFRGCLAALDIQEEANRWAAEVARRDGVALRVRVGLNSGRVIAGAIGSGSLGYAAIGEQVGMASGWNPSPRRTG